MAPQTSAQDKPRILPLVWLLLAMMAMLALHRWLPLARPLAPPWTWLGLLPMVLGLWMAVVSAHAFRRADTGLLPFDEARVLVSDGWFRFTRNPIYLGMVLFLLGLLILLGSLSSLLPVAAFVWIIHHGFILREEAFMEAAMGEQYRAYKARVRRWL